MNYEHRHPNATSGHSTLVLDIPSVAAEVAGASNLVKPVDESAEGEGLGKGRGLATLGGRGDRSGRLGLGDGGNLGLGLGDGGSLGLGGLGGGLGLLDGRAGAAAAGASGVQSGSGDRVVLDGGVGVEEDAGLIVGVELGAEDTDGVVGAGAGDLNVHALGVVLGTVQFAGGVKRDDLVTEDVVAGRDGRGHGSDPFVTVGDQLDSGPLLSRLVETGLLDLDPLEGLDINVGAVASAVGDVGDDGADMRVGPVGPLPLDGAASRDGGAGSSRARVLQYCSAKCVI